MNKIEQFKAVISTLDNDRFDLIADRDGLCDLLKAAETESAREEIKGKIAHISGRITAVVQAMANMEMVVGFEEDEQKKSIERMEARQAAVASMRAQECANQRKSHF